MKLRPLSLVCFGVALVLLLSTLGWLQFRRDGVQEHLPPIPETDLPAIWRERVYAAYEAVRETGSSSGAIRELARIYHANRHHIEARQCYNMLVETGSKLTAQDHYHLADILGQLGDNIGAASELGEVLTLEPEYLPARVTLGFSLLKSNDPDGAAREFEKVLATDPLHIDATMGLARLALQRGDEASALGRLEKLIVARPEATSAVALLAQVLERRGQIERAATLRERSLQRPEPIAPDPWKAELDPYIYDLGLLGLRFEEHAQVGDWSRARVFLARIEELEPHGPLAPMLQGSVAARARRHEEAASHFRAALARGGDAEKICPVLVSALLALNQTESALELMSGHLAKQPNSVALLVAYSEVLIKRKDHPEARQVLSRVLEIRPYLVPQAFALAEILWAKSEHDAAAEYLQRVAQADTKHLAARALLAEHHLRRSDPNSALMWLEQTRHLAPTQPEIRQQLANLLFAAHMLRAHQAIRNGSPETALRDLDLALGLSPESAQAHADRAQVLVRLGNYEGAADSLQKLAELQPENPTVLLSLGDLRMQLGQTEAAMQHWKNARRLAAPGDNRLREAIEQRLAGATLKTTPR